MLLVSAICYSQNEEIAIKELTKLHSRTKFVRDSIGNVLKIYNGKIDIETDISKKENLYLLRDSLYNISDLNDIEELKIDIAYCKKNPSCIYSFDLVNSQVARQPGKNFYNEFEYIYNNASAEIKQSENGKKMAEKLIFFKQSMIGSMAPKFFGVDIFDHKISLDEFLSKKYVLIDFWASWCGPCREEIPFMNELHKKYKDQGFEIVSISIDDDLSKWRNAVKKEQIEHWKHFSTVQNKSSVNKDYFVNGVPHKILVDKNGKIIGKWKASGEKNKKELQNQLVEIFGY